MRICLLFILTIAIFTECTYASVHGIGKVTLTGEIVESACTIATDDAWQEIDFGVISLGEFSELNSSISKPFSIHLVNCSLDKKDGGVWNSVNVTFDGVRNKKNEDMFAMTGKGKGFGLNIVDSNGYYALPGIPITNTILQENETELNFNLHIKRNNDDLIPGHLSSFIRFMISYQ